MPGATVNVESPNLQGIVTVVTSENGDYIVPQLPPGNYKSTFELTGFERQERTVALAPTQTLPLNVTNGGRLDHRNRERCRRDDKRANPNRASGDKLQTGFDRVAADQPRTSTR